jgi:hypothetical protein
MARGDALRKQETPDGGEVYSGPLAKAALQAVGARAMTMDQSIVVDEGFDLANPEDQALYAHERFHQIESGGAGAEGARDSEEIAARAIERMVLHRAKRGDEFTDIMRDVEEGPVMRDAAASGGTSGESDNSKAATDDEATAALAALLKSGKSQEAVVEELARFVVQSIAQSGELTRFRGGGMRSF